MSNYADQIVYIIDDDEPVRDSIALLLSSVRIETKQFSCATEFLTSFDHDKLGCIILDIQMPQMTGLELQESLLKLQSCLPIIFVSGHGDVPMAVKALKNGAVEFLQKPFDDQRLIDAVFKALDENQKLIDTRLKQKSLVTRMASLTPREKEVMQAVIKGHANKVIASDLGLSQRTVEVHRANVMQKMGAKNLAEIIYLAGKL